MAQRHRDFVRWGVGGAVMDQTDVPSEVRDSFGLAAVAFLSCGHTALCDSEKDVFGAGPSCLHTCTPLQERLCALCWG